MLIVLVSSFCWYDLERFGCFELWLLDGFSLVDVVGCLC